ncbi:MAG: anti-sigma factor antagonist [Methylococcaceae bacterium]|nr:MAG: anti-sigma factor antagonist [Methylococcaceae bacterium]
MADQGSIIYRLQDNEQTLCVEIHDSFCFDLLREFRQICERARYKRYIIDLRYTTYIDSSALGMLMVLHRFVDGDRQAVAIVNASDTVLDILRIAHFNQFFDISGLQKP